MTKEPVSNATEMVDPALALEILDRVDAFYNNAWLKLLVIGSLMLVVIGFLGPLLVQWYQRRFFRLEEQKLRDELSEESKGEIQKLFEDESQQIEERFRKNSEAIEARFGWLEAGIFLTQGHAALGREGYSNAFVSYLSGVNSGLGSKDEAVVQSLIGCAVGVLSSFITKADLDDTARDLRGRFEKLLEKLEKSNNDHRYDRPIGELKQAFKEAEHREAEVSSEE